MTDIEKEKHNIKYIINMLLNEDYSREEIIKELKKELEHIESIELR